MARDKSFFNSALYGVNVPTFLPRLWHTGPSSWGPTEYGNNKKKMAHKYRVNNTTGNHFNSKNLKLQG